jgi:hypothetical protein
MDMASLGRAGVLAVLLSACARDRERPIVHDPTPTNTIEPTPEPPRPPESRAPLVVTATFVAGPPPSVQVEIRNLGSDVDLDDRMGIEFEQAGGWVAVHDLYDTIAETCAGLTYGAPKTPRPCQHLASGASRKPPSWLGFTCSSQCIGTCRGNSDHPKGRYRFLVTTCDDAGRRTYASDPIDWPGVFP